MHAPVVAIFLDFAWNCKASNEPLFPSASSGASEFDFFFFRATVLAMEIDTGALRLTKDPFENFARWMTEAEASSSPEPTAMTLATASRDGRPSARVVLFKGMGVTASGEKGFCFFTNYDSPKSRELLENPYAALVFFWAPLGRQIRIDGRVEKVTEAESNDYFASRPRGSRIGAWASTQSRPIQSREELLKRVKDFEERYPGEVVPRPSNWGGWILVPTAMEFWQAGEFRLHDRFLFSRSSCGSSWDIARLSP